LVIAETIDWAFPLFQMIKELTYQILYPTAENPIKMLKEEFSAVSAFIY